MSGARGPRRPAGFTLVETMVVLALLGVAFIFMINYYQTGLLIEFGSISQTPLATANANLSTTLRDNIRSATCIVQPASGTMDSMLIAWTGTTDCPDQSPGTGTAFSGGTAQYFAVCVNGNGQLLFQPLTNCSGSCPALGSLTCGASGYWGNLAPQNMIVGGWNGTTNANGNIVGGQIFSRPSAPTNVVYSSMTVAYPFNNSEVNRWSQSNDPNTNPYITWTSTFTAQHGLQ